MTKADLVAAIADAPDDAIIYIDDGKGLLRSAIVVDVEPDGIVLSIDNGDDADEQEAAA
jgi:hypothetical protein